MKASLKNMSKSNMANLQERMELTVDGVEVPLPNIEGLCVLNIGRYGVSFVKLRCFRKTVIPQNNFFHQSVANL